MELNRLNKTLIKRALVTAGLIENLIINRGSNIWSRNWMQRRNWNRMCHGLTHLGGGDPHQIEYSTEMGMEHHLGLTCDQCGGLCRYRA